LNLVTLGSKVIFQATSDDEGHELWSYEPDFPSGVESPEILPVSAFPNPSSDGIFHFTAPVAAELSILIRDVLGKEIQRETVNGSQQFSVDLALFPKGIYFVEMKASSQRWLSKLVYQ
jgi:hypothetical protein